ncbi:MAG: alpha-galactosidase [Lachnobacterium sp.]|nr:alpha-galactosidase [Lachnobacterium sp.]MDY5460998.1 alpha-galactosidase [Agathobacter sp.]
MAIIYNPNKRIFTLHTKHSTYQMQVDSLGYLLHLYYGAKNNSSMEYVLTYADRGFSGNPYAAGADRTYSLDALPQEFPTLGTGDYRNIALDIKNSRGIESTNLLYKKHEIRKGKYALPGLPAVWADEAEAQTLEIVLADENAGMEVHLLYGVLEEADVITRSAVIRNIGTETVTIEKAAAACLDFVSGNYDVIRFYGKHAFERNVERTVLGHGTIAFGSRRGTSSHQYNPAVILAEQGTTEEAGNCYGMLMVYSGNFFCEAERDQYNQTRLLMGLNDELFSYPLAAGDTFTVPEVILSYSQNGLSALSQQYHNCIRNHVCRSKYVHMSRPVLINSWEAAYFDFTGETIVNLAKEAASLGIDMVVMDDGWFGKRDDDNSSLGDWYVNEKKLGGSLSELIRRVHEQGVKFGIWIEPEMVNEDSDLYRAHPDWAIQIPGRKPIRSRNQLLLDFSRKEVRDQVFEQICAVLDQGEIDYVKWDMNRSMADVYAGNLTYDYVLGVYDFMERLTSRYPDMLLEGCSGGGGRFDAGMLYYSPQIWCSDNTDAINRTRIQYGTSFFYPVSAVGAHVSAVPNHQTGRVTSFHTRGVTAMAGTFGYELNPALLSDEEKQQVREQIASYKKYERLINEGTYWRLSDPIHDEIAAWMSVSKEQDRALVSVVRLMAEANQAAVYVRLRGLKPKAVYLEEYSGKQYSGAALMHTGIVLPFFTHEYEAYQFSFVELTEALHLYEKVGAWCEDKQEHERLVISLFGGSGSGKTTIAGALQQYLLNDGIGCFLLGGDDYPHRIPKRNDEERLRIFEESGEDGLRDYLGTPQEIDFDRINEVIADFHAGKNTITLRHMGREDGEIFSEETSFEGIRVLIVEWTHGGSEYLEGVDLPVFLESSPEETRERRIRRNRDANAASPFINMVVELEGEKLKRQRNRAKLIVGKDKKVYEQ